jgi:hypothetical protein
MIVSDYVCHFVLNVNYQKTSAFYHCTSVYKFHIQEQRHRKTSKNEQNCNKRQRNNIELAETIQPNKWLPKSVNGETPVRTRAAFPH